MSGRGWFEHLFSFLGNKNRRVAMNSPKSS